MSEFIKKNRETLLITLSFLIASFLVFYWTGSYFSTKKTQLQSQEKTLCGQVKKTKSLYRKISSNAKTRNLCKTGLLNFFQKMGQDLSITDKIVSIRPKKKPNFSEFIMVRLENLSLNEIVDLLKYIERYSNLSIVSFTLNKNFTDPTRANIIMDVGKNNA